MNKFTSVEQSKRLCDILPYSTSDFCYQHIIKTDYVFNSLEKDQYILAPKLRTMNLPHIPAWSLGALFEILEPFDYKIFNTSTGYDIKLYCDNDKIKLSSNNLIDLLVETICKMKKSNFSCSF